ncbi:MAG TPA: hypothetical protein VGM24_04410 [Puia sp.]|jgi:hypothetical protein
MGKTKWIWILGAILMVGMISCKKGDTGPAGPAGPAGPDSVVYSAWIPLSPTYNADDTLFEQTISAPSITQAILDSGVILSYVNFGSTGSYDVVPVSAVNYLIQEDFSVGSISLLIPPSYDLSGLPYRYVTIPGSKIEGNRSTGAVKGITIQELKTMPYAKVQALLEN